MRVLVTGASGFVGRHLIAALLEAGHDVIALVRDPSSYDPPEGVDVVEGDFLDSSVELPTADAAYYLIHSMRADGDFAERDRTAARTFADAASAAGIERVIYLGGLGGDDDGLSEHLRSRREIEHVLQSGDYELTTLRAAIVIGEGSASWQIVRDLARRLPVMVTPRWVRNPCQPIYIDDAVAYLVGVLEVPETAGETFEIGGPDVLSYQTIVTRTAELLGKRRPIVIPVPVLSPGLSSRWLGLVTDVPTSVARPLVEGLRSPVVVTDDRIGEYVEIDRTPFDEAVRATLDAERNAR